MNDFRGHHIATNAHRRAARAIKQLADAEAEVVSALTAVLQETALRQGLRGGDERIAAAVAILIDALDVHDASLDDLADLIALHSAVALKE